MARKPQIGSISSGTLRSEDLIQAFVDELEDLIRGNGKTGMANEGELKLVTEARDWLDSCESVEDDSVDIGGTVYDDETGSELVNDLIDALNEYAPDYCHFGASEGDGADFGFWPSIDSLEEDARNEDRVLKVDAGDEPDFFMSVNDHGNVTLYRVTLEEVWSVV